ncbi:Snakin-2 [Orobanche gracilis]
MAISKVLIIAAIFLSLLALIGVQAIHANDQVNNAVYTPDIDCGGLCAERCALSGRPHLCNRACGTCCARCHCVPPGTSGNYETCHCYANLTTRGNKRKCP